MPQNNSTVTFWMASTKWLVTSTDLHCFPKMAAKSAQLGKTKCNSLFKSSLGSYCNTAKIPDCCLIATLVRL